ncbi:Ribosomal protein S6 kinase alpha-2 [Allomyces javanicus]|nr:Ribosomal protein S6 kinase alpha-2 [Allomyces javanicus]
MSHKDFVVIKLLGTGGFARVYLVQHASTGELFAMKVMQKIYKPRVRKAEKRKAKKAAQADAAAASANNSPTPSPPGSPRAKIYVEGIKERDILASINNHPFLVTLRYAFQDDRHLYLLLDWVEGGELWYYVASEGMCLEDTACFYVAEIVLALEHLHSIGIIYRDLKLENILIDGTGHLKMTDFGLSKLAFDETFALKANSFCGTRAPEMVSRKSYDEKLDVWGLGILLFIMLTGKLPFTGKTPKDLESAILNRKPQFPSFLTNEARDLITKLLRKDPTQRPSITAIKKHPFFRSIDWAKLARLEIPPPQVPPRSTIHEEVQALLGARRRRVHSVLTADGVTAIAAANFGDLAHPLDELQRVFQDFSFPARPKAPDDHRGEKRSGEDVVVEKGAATSSESEPVSEVEG